MEASVRHRQYNTKEACGILGVSDHTVHFWAKSLGMKPGKWKQYWFTEENIEAIRKARTKPPKEFLSEVDKEIIRLTSEGLAVKEISLRLGMEDCEVTRRRVRIYKAQGLKNPAHLISWGFRNNILK